MKQGEGIIRDNCELLTNGWGGGRGTAYGLCLSYDVEGENFLHVVKVALGVELRDVGISKDDVNHETEFCSPRKFGINNIIQVGGVA